MEPRPWTCAHCGGRLAWTSSTVGCRSCRTVVVLSSASRPAYEEEAVLEGRFLAR